MTLPPEATILTFEEENPFTKITSGRYGIYIPASTSYLCCEGWSNFWFKTRCLRVLISLLVLTLCGWAVLVPILSILINLTCFTDLLHAIIAIRNIVGACFVFSFMGITCRVCRYQEPAVVSLNHPISGEIISSIMSFTLTDEPGHNPKWEKFFFGFRFLTLVSAFLTTVPLLNKNIWPLEDDDGNSPRDLLIAEFTSTVVRTYHYQLFWIICYGVLRIIQNQMGQLIKEMEKIGITSEHSECQMKEAETNLMEMRKLCTQIIELVSTTDDKISWSVFLGVVETVCGIAAPFFLYVNSLHLYTEPVDRVVVHLLYIPWIVVRSFIFVYSFRWGMQIPKTYSKYVARYKIAVYKILSVVKWPQFEESFQFTKRELLEVQPCFTIAGFMNMKISALAILTFGQMLLGIDIIATINNKIVHQNITKLFDYYIPRCVKHVKH